MDTDLILTYGRTCARFPLVTRHVVLFLFICCTFIWTETTYIRWLRRSRSSWTELQPHRRAEEVKSKQEPEPGPGDTTQLVLIQ